MLAAGFKYQTKFWKAGFEKLHETEPQTQTNDFMFFLQFDYAMGWLKL